MNRYIVVLGGYSEVGKGTLVSSIGYLLQEMGYQVGVLKFDGLLNYNKGNKDRYHEHSQLHPPRAHEEVFVLADGYEGAADLGNYERFLDKDLDAQANLTGGQVFRELVERDLNHQFLPGEFLTFHTIRWLCQKRLRQVSADVDVTLVEIGGTVGDVESSYFWDALLELREEPDVTMQFILIAPLIEPLSEHIYTSRTKLIRQTCTLMRRRGMKPSTIVCRCQNDEDLEEAARTTIATVCRIPSECIFVSPQLESIYELPTRLDKQGLMHVLGWQPVHKNENTKITGRLESYVGKRSYCQESQEPHRILILSDGMGCDSYTSLNEALEHSATAIGKRILTHWIFEENQYTELEKEGGLAAYDALIVGESNRFIEEKLKYIQIARRKCCPFLGLSIGFDLAAVEFARNVCGLLDTIPQDLFTQNTHLLHITPLKLGSHAITLHLNTQAYAIYRNEEQVYERFRKCTVLTCAMQEKLAKAGLIFSGIGDTGEPEILELLEHQFFIAIQAHPEYKSHPGRPHPLFVHFVRQIGKLAQYNSVK